VQPLAALQALHGIEYLFQETSKKTLHFMHLQPFLLRLLPQALEQVWNP
jgi:hypothetical protein